MRFVNKLGIVIPAAGAKVKIQADPVTILHYRSGKTKVTFLERLSSAFPACVYRISALVRLGIVVSDNGI